MILEADEGYKILVVVKELDIDGTSKDLLLIKPGNYIKYCANIHSLNFVSGKSLEDDNEGRILTYKLKSPRKILLDTNEAFLQLQVNGMNENNQTGFTLTYQRYGKVLSQIITLHGTVMLF